LGSLVARNVVLVAAAVSLISAGPAWSRPTGLVVAARSYTAEKIRDFATWSPPSGSTARVKDAIAFHVAGEYHLANAGPQLVGVTAGPPEANDGTKVLPLSVIAIRRVPLSRTGVYARGIYTYGTSHTWAFSLRGTGAKCTFATGQATELRDRLIRREALELALYTFEFVPAVTSLIVYLPPASATAPGVTVLYLDEGQLKKQLSEPLDRTLPLASPPLPTAPDPTEATAIDKLTLPDLFNASLTKVYNGTGALVLAPIGTR
jgi:hypothetical protein